MTDERKSDEDDLRRLLDYARKSVSDLAHMEHIGQQYYDPHLARTQACEAISAYASLRSVFLQEAMLRKLNEVSDQLKRVEEKLDGKAPSRNTMEHGI